MALTPHLTHEDTTCLTSRAGAIFTVVFPVHLSIKLVCGLLIFWVCLIQQGNRQMANAIPLSILDPFPAPRQCLPPARMPFQKGIVNKSSISKYTVSTTLLMGISHLFAMIWAVALVRALRVFRSVSYLFIIKLYPEDNYLQRSWALHRARTWQTAGQR